jgi:hypothetical protein
VGVNRAEKEHHMAWYEDLTPCSYFGTGDSDRLLAVAPSLILHSMDAHEYAPPAAFCEAVLACPPMRSMDYLRAILKNGPPGFTRGGRETPKNGL